MPTLENNWYRRTIFISVYFVQTLITVTTLSLFPMLFADIGINPFFYGVAGSLSLLPMAFKFFIGPLSDKFPIPFLRGRRRGYIILGALLNIIFLPFLALNPMTFMVLFFAVWFCQTLGIAIIDILTDTLAVGGTKSIQNLQGRTGASVWMFIGIFIGGGVASAFAGMFEGHTLDPVFDTTVLIILVLAAIITLVPLILIWFLKEGEESQPEQRSIREDIKRNLKHPFVRWGLLFAFLLNIDGGLLELTLEPFVKDELGAASLSAVVATLFFISLLGVIIGVLGYKFIDRVKKNRLLAIIAAIYIIPSLLLAIMILNGTLTLTTFYILFGVFALVSGLSYVTYISLFLDLSDPKAAGTMIALFFTVSNLGIVIGVAFGGVLISIFGGVIGIAVIYLIAVVTSGLRIFPLLRIKMEDIAKTFSYQVDD